MIYARKTPVIDPDTFIAENAVIIGDVTIARGSSVWYNVVIRADRGPVTIGEESNIQDGSVIHMDRDLPVIIGNRVTVGHGAIVHGAKVGDGCLIGMGAVLMNRCEIGENSIVGAGSLVTQGKVIPPRSLVMGSPARVVRELTDEEVARTQRNADAYIEETAEYQSGCPVFYRAAPEA
ncbi:MAG: gamma carbonic anhydrase family protein [Lachnospiraceae bacterium]|nr:gamma carbonic anhydrase family protein [Lachnospiraceae bacterium]